jgi:hypothetical protein
MNVTIINQHRIEVSGNTVWQSYKYNVNWSNYKKVFVYLYVYSAQANSGLFDSIFIGYNGYHPTVQLHWDDGNTGQVTLHSTDFECYAKTQTFPFIVTICGLN